MSAIKKTPNFLFFLDLDYINVPVQRMQAIGTDRSMLTGHYALLSRQIARDLLHA